ncbi:MAG: hypothetical protein HZA53_18130 [Planctomycetes bacterium]|nr:hypothetical protein [Planctomycetota bacterium]
MIQRFQGRGPGAESTAAHPLSFEEPLEALTGRIAEPGTHEGPIEAGDPNALRALRYHDGLALIAQERRALHAARRLVKEMLEIATRAAWPATNAEARAMAQIELRNVVKELAELCATTEFRGVRLLNGECPMIAIHDGPESGEFLVLGLRDVQPEALGNDTLDLCSGLGARFARQNLRLALDSIDGADEVVVCDLHELLAGARVSS